MAGRGAAGGGPMRPGRIGHTPTSLAAGFAITARPGPGGPSRQAARLVIPLTARPDNGGAGQMRCHRQIPSGAARRRARPPSEGTADRETRPEGRAGPRGKRPFNRVSARRAGSVTRHPQARSRPAMMWPPAAGRRIAGMTILMLPADLAAVSSLPLVGQRATSSLPTMRCGSMACSSQPGGAEQPVLVPLLRWSSPAQVALPAVLRPARRFVPSAGRDLVAGRVVLLEAEPAGCTWQQGPGQRASSVGGPGPAVAGLSGSRTARTVPARPARQASPLGWRSRSRYRPVATVASPCHPRQRA